MTIDFFEFSSRRRLIRKILRRTFLLSANLFKRSCKPVTDRIKPLY